MEVRRNEIIPLGYGKYYRSDRIVGLEPIWDDRGPARRTNVYIEGRDDPVVASRSEEAIIKDLAISQEEFEASVAIAMLERVMHEMEKVGPILRRSIREETGLDIDDLILRVRRVLSREDADEEFDQGSLFAS